MKIVHLIRHAKSDWSNPSIADRNRPINAKGRQNCLIMAPQIVDAGCGFTHVYSSPAERARKTIELIAKALPEQKVSWELDEALYTLNGLDILSWCRKRSDTESDVVIIGHNPALTDFCNEMVGDELGDLPTTAYVQLHFDTDSWQELAKGTARLAAFLKPKMFKP